ncbi:MAG: response regulator [Burkholderiales bacterium]|jgi:two-component system cell cycle response regulator|nr:response regulator [Burkholderiales bacterium]MCA3165750.1 response regulator [Burkholderiales bacterium]
MDQTGRSINSPLPALAEDLGNTPIYTVQVLGFSSKERTLFASMFHLSKIRAMRYVEFDKALHPYPDFYIISTDSPAAIEQFSRLDRNRYGGALFIGNHNIRTSLPVLRKPIKWAEVLMRLDELPRPKLSAQIHELLEAGIIGENDLIIQRPAAAVNTASPSARQAAPDRSGWSETVPIEPKSDTEAGPHTLMLQHQANAENNLELESVNRWYETQNVKTLTTPAFILVVDEDIATRRYMAAKFLELSYRVDFAESGEQALELFRINRYNAVFMDVYLPGIDGYEVCKHIKARAERRKTAVIFVTSKHSTFDRVKGAMAGCDAYLTKPLKQARLVEVLDKFIPHWRMNQSEL